MSTVSTSSTARNKAETVPNVIAHTIITLVVVSFCGIGMLQGKIPATWFIGVGFLSLGWLPPAIVGNIIIRVLQQYKDAVLMAPPNGERRAISPENTQQREAAREASNRDDDDNLPPPGVTGMVVFLGGLLGIHAASHGMGHARVRV